MAHIQVTDEWLYKYMPIVDEALMKELEDSADCQYQFSEKFERKMRLIMWKEAHLWGKSGLYKRLKYAAVCFCGIVASVFLLSMSVEGNRIKFFETVKRFWEGYAEYVYVSEEENGEFHSQEPGYVPDGYEEVERYELASSLTLLYENDIGELITWDQRMVSDGDSTIFDTEYDKIDTIIVEGKYVTIYSYSSGFVSAYCEYKEYIFTLTADHITTGEIYKMFASKNNRDM